MHLAKSLLHTSLFAAEVVAGVSSARRRSIVQSFNPHRSASSSTTPLQVGNGNFAFGADITGLQTFAPFAIQSTWGWHNFSLPTTANQTSPAAEEEISNWLVMNPQRLNLANIGLYFGEDKVIEDDLLNKSQDLDLWTGQILSEFTYNGFPISVQVTSHPENPVVGIQINSTLLKSGKSGIFFDFPYADLNKFDAPYVGVWNATTNNTVKSHSSHDTVIFNHTIDSNVNQIAARWSTNASISGPLACSNEFVLNHSGSDTLQLVVAFPDTYSPSAKKVSDGFPSYTELSTKSKECWSNYWTAGAFIDLSATKNASAQELQRRIILSQYLVAVNEASSNPPQESGLVNNGWYGKFHLEMTLWHCLHFARWGHYDLLSRTVPNTYHRFLQSSVDRAAQQGYKGARWGKMTDPSGRDAPGDINALLIWQQPHIMHFAEYFYRAFPEESTLKEWDEVITATADFMVSYAWWNASIEVYDLGPPLYPVSENTNPNVTINSTFELAYWRFALDIAIRWKERQSLSVPKNGTTVRDNLAPLPVVDDAYAVYEGIPDMWKNETTTVEDHLAMAGIYGLLPPPSTGSPLSVNTTVESYGWDLSMLAMNSLRLGDVDQAVAYLLDSYYQFDDAGYPEGGSRVSTPYMPDAGGLLLTTAMMAGGWDGEEGPHFPKDRNVEVEGFSPSL
ncbi:hypothetical protein BO85DRAFT_510107 [Aspergillus piperis CBS 112811]|uniref:Six-hairpin glycosidase n=1 Tax=Aspergillus piperis CBS 112811 TaxID=1448313 RepID=A0A8G1VIE6_9EURO|nr:hypothetical protein BO85DRAFT_510107 [Aspergillus piperis CBS 112811]RAH51638.1 hypothetical protein BO85DRAFT_510107 [Aspergillus piperis CBS 112811]